MANLFYFFEHFTGIFVMLFVFAFAYAVLEASGLFKEMKGVNALIAFGLAIFVGLSKTITGVILAITPWFFLMFLFFGLLWTLGMFLGWKQDEMIFFFSPLYKQKPQAFTVIFWIGVIILAVALGSVGKQVIESGGNTTITNATGGLGQNIMTVLINPKVLGFILIMFIGWAAINNITQLGRIE
ncbi:hypothetical protein COV22_03950 [Candidatus Woesearchaeota archaeon CG10_big_fil_rev_8_21_14_0_10_47_5]|nr:MAG: hypothetical protein AUJ69_01120 [Candidatus Woesearchaeota archaeon CG1_02_47_18]PIN72165.1 MAG: hypothetical protein COV22_03950 [Candidatus Woesearchaeota archaeon CG10_big_fil_rev_8_21_14_0_10_47_5]